LLYLIVEFHIAPYL